MGTDTKVLAIIPARYASQRFPGKVLAPLGGKPLVAHTAERTARAKLVSETLVATDDDRVREALEPLGIRVVMTRPDHPSGTDRIAEAAQDHDAQIIVNVQGDEPLIEPDAIDSAIRPLIAHPEIPMATLCHTITERRDIEDPNVVKVVCDTRGRAIYFSRCPIPYAREGFESAAYFQHVGLYVYRRDFLLEYARMKPTPLERTEKLEQLRVLENGYPIAVVETQFKSIGVDTPEDLERARAVVERALNGE